MAPQSPASGCGDRKLGRGSRRSVAAFTAEFFLSPLVRQDRKLLVIAIFAGALKYAALGREIIACKGAVPAPAGAKKMSVGHSTAGPVAIGGGFRGQHCGLPQGAPRSLPCNGKCAD